MQNIDNNTYAKPSSTSDETTTSSYSVSDPTNGVLYNQQVLTGQMINPDSDRTRSGAIVKFKLTLPDNALMERSDYRQLYQSYTGQNGFHDGNSFILYALISELSESVEQAITVRRTKGGYLENHWGARPSVIQANGQVGVFLSSLGLMPFQAEDPDGNSETVLYWDPTATTIMINGSQVLNSNSSSFTNSAERAINKTAGLVGNAIGGPIGSLISSFNYTSSTNPSSSSSNSLTVDANQAAGVGTNLAFRNFRLLLNLFRHNGLILDTIPNVTIFPSTFTAPDYYTLPNGQLTHTPSIAESNNGNVPVTTLLSMGRTSYTAPGNVLASLPVEMYIKNTKYTGYFQNFNYSFDSENPYVAFYDFAFIAKKTERTAVFFTSGTAGRKPFSDGQALKVST